MDDSSSLALASGTSVPNTVPGQGMPPPPPGYGPQQPAQALQPQLPMAQQQMQLPQSQQQAQDMAGEAILQKAQRDQAAWQDYQTKQQPLFQKLRGELSVGTPRYPDQEKLPDPPKPQDYQKYSFEFAAAFSVLGALAGKFTRAGGTGALDAFAGAMKGYQQGNLQAYKSASDEWEQRSTQVLANNKQILDKYKAVIENRRMSIEDKMLSMKMLSAEYQIQIAHDAVDADNVGLAMQWYDKSVDAQNKAVDRTLKLADNKRFVDEQMQGKAQQWLSPAGRAQYDKLTPENRMLVDGLIRTYGPGGTVQAGSGAGMQGMVKAVGEYRIPITTAMSRLPAEDRREFMAQLSEQYPDYNATVYGAEQATATTEARVEANRETNLNLILNSTKALIPDALRASEAVPRGQWVRVNDAVQSYEKGTSDPKLKEFAVKNLQLAELWARAMNPTGQMRVEDRRIALDMLNVADGPEAYKSAVNSIKSFIEREKGAIVTTRQESRSGGAQQSGGQPSSVPTATSPQQQNDPLGIR